MIGDARCLFIETDPSCAAVSACSPVRSICRPTLIIPLPPSAAPLPLTVVLDNFGVDSLGSSSSKAGMRLRTEAALATTRPKG